MTVFVYGLVAGIVKLDDLGLHLMLKKGQSVWRQCQRKFGQKILAFAPYLMRGLTIVGTAAMFLVGGSIIGHGIPPLHHLSEYLVESVQHLPTIGATLSMVTPILVDAVIGLLAGAISVGIFQAGLLVLSSRKH